MNRTISAIFLLAVAACSSSESNTDTPATGGGDPVNGCSTYQDRTADGADRTIKWERSMGTVCLKIKKGQAVTFNPEGTTFAAHPLDPQGGSSPNPITGPGPVATPHSITFASAGTFGFVCSFHPDMTGAIQVVE